MLFWSINQHISLVWVLPWGYWTCFFCSHLYCICGLWDKDTLGQKKNKNNPSNSNRAWAPAVAGLLINSWVSVSGKIILIKKWWRLGEEWQHSNQSYQPWLGRLALPEGGGLPLCCCLSFVYASNPWQNNGFGDFRFSHLVFLLGVRLY